MFFEKFYRLINGKNDDSKEAIQKYEESKLNQSSFDLIKTIFKYGAVIIGLVIVSICLNISDKIRNFNPIAGYVSMGIFLVLFIWFYIRPLFQIFHTPHFEVDLLKNDTRFMKSYNAKIRKNIAIKIIEFNDNVGNVGWYDEEYVEKIRENLQNNDSEELKNNLTSIMNGSIKKASDDLIVKNAVQAGLMAAVSQSPLLDALLVATIDFNMIKDIIFLYGFRPTKAKLFGIFFRVIFGSLAAYSIEDANLGSKMFAKITEKAIPIPGINNVASYLGEATIQGATNGALSMWVGFKTIDYLMKEYRLQEIIDNIDVIDDEKEYANTKEKINKQLNKKIPTLVKNK